MSLFTNKIDGLPLRKRVAIEMADLKDVRYMLEKFHYLHRTRTGRQINYAVFIDGIVDGVITYAYPMMSAPLLGIPSDELLEFARLFLASNIPHSATCAIGKSIKRIKGDWARKFPDAKSVKMIVSWSDSEVHKGTIYKAANFEWVKRTKGDSRTAPRNTTGTKRGARKNNNDYSHDKDCWIYRL